MNYNITFPVSGIEYNVSLPASKSISNRALILNALSKQSCEIKNIAKCDDTDAMLNALAESGDDINIGAAGTAMRFLTGYFSLQENRKVTLDGSARMRQRPISILVNALRECGAEIEYAQVEGFPPITITGKKLVHIGAISLPGNVSSQYISSLMMIAPTISGGLTITLTGDILSVPYIDMTIALMREFGVSGERNDNIITIPEGKYKAPCFKVENDWSAASYWYEIAALLPGSKFFLQGLSSDSVQGDCKVSSYFKQLGVKTEFMPYGVMISNNYNRCERLEIDLTNQPDLAQTIVVSASLLNIPFHIKGLATLKIKETDRIEALRSQLKRLGYIIDVTPDFALTWNGEKCDIDKNPEIDTFDDHRMAMAFAPAAIIFSALKIKDIEVVSKSYPDFWAHLSEAGVTLR